jgi:hypothetical protein
LAKPGELCINWKTCEEAPGNPGNRGIEKEKGTMKKRSAKLRLHRETLHRLQTDSLLHVVGADTLDVGSCAPRCNTLRCDFTEGCESRNNTCTDPTYTCAGTWIIC